MLSKRNLIKVAASVLILGFAACASKTKTETTTPQAYQQQPYEQPGMARGDQSCPMDVSGTQVYSTETPDGIALVFTTTSGQVEDLRQRVRRTADMYRTHAGTGTKDMPSPGDRSGMTNPSPEGTFESEERQQGTPPQSAPESGMQGETQQQGTEGMTGEGTEGGQGGQGMGAEGVVRYDVRVEDIDNGAQIVFTPRAPTQLQTLRDRVRQHAQTLQAGECPPPRLTMR